MNMNRPQYGMPTLIELSSLEETASLCRELRLDFIELKMDLPQYHVENLDVRELSRIAEKYGVYYTIHLDDNRNPCDFNKRVAKAYTDTALQTIRIATELDIPILNMHLAKGIYSTLPEQIVFLFDKYENDYLDSLRNFRDTMNEALVGNVIKICVENAKAFQQHFGADGLVLLLESPAFSVTFDSGHDAVNGFMQRPTIDRHIDRLCHMHLHDTILEQHRDHLPLGAGELDIPSYLDLAREHECRVLLETKTVAGLKQSVVWLKERGYL
jgi:sugar phosphate isomerase/epimerase